MKRILPILLLCLALLTAGCGRSAGEPADPTPSAVPTSGAAASLPTEAPPTETASSAGIAVTQTAPTDPPAPAPGQLGTPSFTLAGETFTMGESPDRLLAFLGEPEETFEWGHNLYDGTNHVYHYTDIWVTAFQPTGSEGSVLTDVYFLTDRYAVDGVSVGSAAADLRRAAPPESETAYPLFHYQDFLMGTEIGGWGYRLDRERETPGDTYWAFLFTYEDDPQIPADDAPILCIHIYCVYPQEM